MPTSKKETTERSLRGDVSEEQALCNEALESHSYDGMSDSEWVALCEALAVKGRDEQAEVTSEVQPDVTA